jgi:hypothetical protein
MVKARVGTSVPASHTTAPATSLFAMRVGVRLGQPVPTAVVQGNQMEDAMQLCAGFHKTAEVTDSIERGGLIGTRRKGRAPHLNGAIPA